MTPDPTLPTREQRLEVILLTYLQAADAGKTPDRDEFLAKDPEFAAELTDFFAGLDRVGPALDPLRQPRVTQGPAAHPTIPGYEVLGELGRGGMGVVYKARQLRLDRVVALKMVLAQAHAGVAELGRFRTEAEAIARLQHPGIVQIFEVDEHDGLPFFSLEYCPGGSLDKTLTGTPLPAGEAAGLVRKLAEAIDAAHRQGIVHRDVKPANVLLLADGSPKLTDFGLAKRLDAWHGHTATGAVLGTPSYMAPEQAGGTARKSGRRPTCTPWGPSFTSA